MNASRLLWALAGLMLVVIGGVPAAKAQTRLAERSPLRAFTDSGETAELPLIDESLHVTIDQQHASSVLRHMYHNRSGSRLEGQFVFRAGQGTMVDGFSYWNGEQKIVGEVFEKQVARQVYESTVTRRRDPGLLEKVGEGSFTFRVFPIEPNEHKRVELRFDQWLARKGGVIEYRVPVARSDADIRIDLNDDRGIKYVASPTHRIDITRDGSNRARIRASKARGTRRELVLRYELSDAPWTLAAQLHRDAGHDGYLVLSLAAPPSKSGAPPMAKDVTLVIDRSGSMMGAPIEHARAAAADVVRRLGDGDRFNVLVFSGTVDALYSRPKPANKRNRRVAIEFIQGTEEGGGTDLALALRSAFERQHDDGVPKSLLFLTDGKSSAKDALEIALRDKRDVRVFTLGVGSGVDRPLLARLASVKRGRFTFIESAGAIESRVANLYKHIESPELVNLSLEVDGGRLHRTYPPSLPDLFANDELRIVSRVSGKGKMRVVLRGHDKDGPVEIEAAVSLPRQRRRPWVGRLWARSRVDHLLEEVALNGETSELRTETIELALAYNLITPYTSFLAIPESELTNESASTLAAARARKRKLLAHNADALALQRGSSGAAAEESFEADEAPGKAPEPMADMDAAPPASEAMSGMPGCASCTTGSNGRGPDPIDVGIWALLAGLLLRRRRD